MHYIVRVILILLCYPQIIKSFTNRGVSCNVEFLHRFKNGPLGSNKLILMCQIVNDIIIPDDESVADVDMEEVLAMVFTEEHNKELSKKVENTLMEQWDIKVFKDEKQLLISI